MPLLTNLKALLLFIFLVTSTPLLSSEGSAPEENSPNIAPNWIKKDIHGNEIALYSELEKGNTAILVFWASWCRFCKALLPQLSEFKLYTKDKPVKIYAMNIWEDGDPIHFLKSKNIQLLTILNSEAIANQYDVKGTPGVVVVAPDRKIIYQRKLGQQPRQIMEEINKAISI